MPSTIIINFEKQDPWYQLQCQDTIYAVNSEGYLIQGSTFSDLPVVKTSQYYQDNCERKQLNSELHTQINAYLDYAQQLDFSYDWLYLGQDKSYFQVNQLQYWFVLNNEPTTILTKMKIAQQHLDVIQQEFQPGQSMQGIDFRFELPVVKLTEVDSNSNSTAESELEIELSSEGAMPINQASDGAEINDSTTGEVLTE